MGAFNLYQPMLDIHINGHSLPHITFRCTGGKEDITAGLLKLEYRGVRGPGTVLRP